MFSTMNDFEKYVVGKVSALLGLEDSEISVNDVVKNNGKKFRGLCIKDKNVNIAPNIYLNDFYDMVQSGKDVDDVVKMILKAYKTNKMDKDIDVAKLLTFENCSEKIVPRVVNYELNIKELDHYMHVKLQDLAVTFHVLVETDEEAYKSMPVTKVLAERWGVNAEELYNLSIKNMKKILPATFKGMGQVLAEMLGVEMTPVFDDIDETLFVISNESKMYGSNAILDNELMNKVYERLGRYYIIPCSVHEVIVFSASERMNPNDVIQMINQVNSTELRPEDILSERLYVYDQNGFQIVTPSMVLGA